MVLRAMLGFGLTLGALAFTGAPVPNLPAPDLPVTGTPSIVAGGVAFRSACAACHGGGMEFAAREWRVDLSPADVVRRVVSRAVLDAATTAVPGRGVPGPTAATSPNPTLSNPASPNTTAANTTAANITAPNTSPHPTPLHDLETGWAVTGYLWSLATTGPEVRRGEALALEAAVALEKDALNVALFHREQVRQLKSAVWVLNHRQADLIDLMAALAGRRFRALEPSDQVALTEYITLSYFAWPPEW